MRKTLGDYNIEKSSSTDLNNISWSQKKQKNEDKPRKKENLKTNLTVSGTNIIYKKDEGGLNNWGLIKEITGQADADFGAAMDFDGETLLAFSKKEDTRPIISTKVDQEPCMKQGDIGVTGTNKEMFYPTEKLLFKYQKSQAGP